MKLKPIYIYAIVFILAVLFLVIFTNRPESESEKTEVTNSEMPNDDIHKNLNTPGNGMGIGGVSGSARKKLEDLQTAYESNPKDTASAKEYADILNAAHQPQKALDIYQAILAVDQTRIDILLGATFSYYNMNKLDKAEEFTMKVLDIDKNNLEANYNLGAIYAMKGDKTKAKEYWEFLINNYPNSEAAKLAKSSLAKL